MIYIFPSLLVVNLLLLFAIQVHKRNKLPVTTDIGLAFLAIASVYGVVPGIGFLMAEIGVGEILDQRVHDGWELSTVERIEWMYVVFAVGFALSYSAIRRFRHVRLEHQADARRAVKWIVPLALVLLTATNLMHRLFGSDAGGDYISTYTALRSAPLFLQQLYGVAAQASFAFLVAAIVSLVAASPSKHLRVGAVIACYIAYAAMSSGSRTTAFLCFFAYIVSVSLYTRGVSRAGIFAMMAGGLCLFMLVGLLRDSISESYLGLFQSGEFTSIFINAVDLQQRIDSGYFIDSSLVFYLVDILRIIPSQLLDGQKLDPATWYVQSFYPEFYAAGGGLAFGVITESVIGFGAIEAAIRGMLLGFVFAWLANNLIGRRSSVARVFVYVWLVVLSYQAFRDTTFSLLGRALYQLPPILFLFWFARLPRRFPALPNNAGSLQ